MGLTVSGQRTNKLGDTFVMRRRLALKADVYDEEAVEAHLENGVLELMVPKIPIRGARFIPSRSFRHLRPSHPLMRRNLLWVRVHFFQGRYRGRKRARERPFNSSVTKEDDVSVETVSNEEEEEDGEEEIVFSGASANESELVSQTGSDSAQDSTLEEIKA